MAAPVFSAIEVNLDQSVHLQWKTTCDDDIDVSYFLSYSIKNLN